MISTVLFTEVSIARNEYCCQLPQGTYSILRQMQMLFSSVTMSCSTLQPHGLKHTRLPFTISQSLLKLISIKSVMPFNHLILCHYLLLLSSIFSSIRVSSNGLALSVRWSKYWSFCFSISPSNEYSGMISFKIDCFDLPVVLGSLKRPVVFAVQLLHGVRLLVTPCTAVCQVSLSFTIFHSLLKLIPIALLIPFNYLILYHPLLLLPSIFSIIRVFSNQLAHEVAWVLELQLQHPWISLLKWSPSNEYSGLISFKIDWIDILAVQGTLKSLLQYHSSKESVVWHSAFFIAPLSHPYMTTGKTIALNTLTFVNKVMSLLFNTLPRFVIAFLPRSKCLLISWL